MFELLRMIDPEHPGGRPIGELDIKPPEGEPRLLCPGVVILRKGEPVSVDSATFVQGALAKAHLSDGTSVSGEELANGEFSTFNATDYDKEEDREEFDELTEEEIGGPEEGGCAGEGAI